MNEIDKITFDGKTMSIYQGDNVISMKGNIQDVISLKYQNNVPKIGILKTEEARDDILLQLDILFDDFVVSSLIMQLSEITKSKLDSSFIDLLIYVTIKQVPDITIEYGYKLDCVDRDEYEAIILYTYKKWINTKIIDERTTKEKIFINYVNKDIKNDINDLKDLNEFINKMNVKKIAKSKIEDLSTSDMMYCHDITHRNENLIMFMNHRDGIRDLINHFEMDYEDFVEFLIDNALYETMETFIVSNGKDKLFSCDDKYVITDLLDNMTTECAEWIVERY